LAIELSSGINNQLNGRVLKENNGGKGGKNKEVEEKLIWMSWKKIQGGEPASSGRRS
jgi:hypothetical protein